MKSLISLFTNKRNNKIIIKKLPGVALVCFFLLFLYWAFFAAPAIGWSLNSEQSYYLDMQSGMKRIDMKTGSVTNHLSRVSGVLSTKIIKIENDRVIAGFYFIPDRVILLNNEHPAFFKLYQYPFYVTFYKNGEIDSIRYCTDLVEKDREYIKSMVSYLNYSRKGMFSWKSSEKANDLGILAEYKTGFRSVTKIRKMASVDDSDKVDVQKNIIESRFKYGFKRGWFLYSSLAVDETWRLSDDNSDSMISINIKMEPKSRSIEPEALTAINSNINNNSFANKNNNTVFEQLRLDDLSRDMSKDYYKDLSKKLNDGVISNTQYFTSICDYLKIYPEMASELAMLIRGSKFNNREADLIMFAMGEVGNIECQSALLGIATDNGVSDVNRKRSAVYIGNVAKPDISVIRSMSEFEYNFGTVEKNFYSSAIINSLGRMYNKVSSDGEEAVIIKETLKNIIYEETGSDSLPKKSSALYAIGNTGSDEFIDEIEYVKGDEKSSLRSIAVKALENIPGEEADRLVMDFANDPDSIVRKNAIKTGLAREYREEFKELIISSIPHENSSTVRKTMVEYLGKNRDKDENIKPYLRSLLETENNRSVRDDIFEILYSD
ncbi:MAG: HEAT repeat domain-containing protein [Spirochaetes bacterium]|nr:HEAT repeat domain-containing protein [Spirochaetota bacterium]MBN2770410.1 HEAT repeat domain-containing protein [Spirochaetota bacterium]